MNGYTKLFGSIIASTIWRESLETKVVWITMMAMANKHGIVEASVPGLADMARVSLPETQKALEVLSSPDSFSRTKDFEGRRIEPVDGGWVLLNHSKYREKMSADERRQYNRLKQQEFRERQKRAASKPCQQTSITVNHGQSSLPLSAQAEAEKQRADELPNPSAAPPPADGPCVTAEEIYEAYPKKVGRKAALLAISRAVHASTKSARQVLEATKLYSDAVAKWPPGDERFVPHPTTWFNQARFDDDPSTWERDSGSRTPGVHGKISSMAG